MSRFIGLFLALSLVGCKKAPLETYGVICNGQQYKLRATDFDYGSHGCVTFWKSLSKVAVLCGCSVVARVDEEAGETKTK